jgi:hypothetical protein
LDAFSSTFTCHPHVQLFALLDMHSLLQQVVPSLLVVLAGPPRGDDEHSATHEDGGGCSSSGGGAVAQRQLSPACMALLREFSALVALVARAAAVLFGEYEDVVARDASKILPPDGTIHPLTAQVLSYLKVGGEPWAQQ